MEPKLIIHTNKQTYKKNCLNMLIIGAFLSFIFLFIRNSLGTSYLSIFTQGILAILIAMVSIMLIYSLYRVNNKLPMAIINPQGVWIKQFGIIPWNNILEISAYLIPSTPIQSVGIQVRDTAVLSKQATIAGKMIILESKVLKCPTIVIDNIELDNQTVIDFAQQFIVQSRQF